MIRPLTLIAVAACAVGAWAGPDTSGPPKAGQPWVYPSGWKANHPKFDGPAVKPIFLPAPAVNTLNYPSLDLEPNEGTIGVQKVIQKDPVPTNPAASNIGIQSNALVNSFEGIGETNLTPPDNCISVGGDYLVETVNSVIRICNKAGDVLYEGTAQSFYNLPGTFLYDPKVSYDPWRGRWIMMWHRYDSGISALELAVSADGNPFTSGWWYYAFPGDIGSGSDHSWADYWDLGYSASSVNASGNWFRFSNNSFYSAGFKTWDPNEIYNAMSAHTTTDTGTWPAPRTVKMMNSFYGGPCFVASNWGGGSSLALYRIDDPLGAHTINSWALGVTSYAAPGQPKQPGGGVTGVIDARMMPATLNYSEGTWRIYSSLTCANRADTSNTAANIYIIDPYNLTVPLDWNLWISNQSCYYASPAVNYDGTCNWVYTHSGPSVYPTAAYSDFEPGTGWTNSYANLANGGNSYWGGRWGDYFAGDGDWGDYYAGAPTMKTWFYGEYSNSAGNWATRVGATVTSGATAGIMTVSPSGGIVLQGYAGQFGTSNFNYTVGNSGQVGYRFGLTSKPSYFDASLSGAEIYPGGGATETISNNSGVNSLAYGKHFGNVVFTNRYDGSTINRSTEVDVYAIVPVTSFAVKLGKQTAGNVSSFNSYDGNAVRVCKFIVPNQTTPPVQVEVYGTLPGSSASQLVFRTYIKLVNTGAFKQRMEMWNYNTSNWDATDFRDDALSTSYQTFDLWTTGSAARYIGSGNALKAKYSVRQTGPSSVALWCVDTDYSSWYAFP